MFLIGNLKIQMAIFLPFLMLYHQKIIKFSELFLIILCSLIYILFNYILFNYIYKFFVKFNFSVHLKIPKV